MLEKLKERVKNWMQKTSFAVTFWRFFLIVRKDFKRKLSSWSISFFGQKKDSFFLKSTSLSTFQLKSKTNSAGAPD